MTVQDPSLDAPDQEQASEPAIPRQRGAVSSPPSTRRSHPWITALLVVLMLGQMAFVMVVAARGQSSTPDEPVYIGAAVVYSQQHSLKYNYEHPPLAKEFMAIGLAFGHPHLDPATKGGEWEIGAATLYGGGNDADTLLFLARASMIVLTLLFGLVVFFFARDLAGPIGGLLALALYAFSPDVIGMGSLATLDVPTAGFLLTAAWMLWRARSRPLLYLPLAGLASGAAIATKTNAVVAMPVLLLLAVLSYWHARPGRPWRSRLLIGVLAGVGVGVIALGVLWATYLVVDPSLHWAPDHPLKAIGGLKGRLVDLLPFPQPFIDGIRYQLNIEKMTFGGFLLGSTYTGGKWYYLPVALLIKEPIGAMVLWLIGTITMLSIRRLRAAALYTIVPAGALLIFAMTGSRDFGVRYAIFIPIFFTVVAATVVAIRPRWVHVAAFTLVLYVAVSSVLTFPHYIPYSNEAFGGPAKTWQNLNDSNSDWGQDLKQTSEWLHQHYPGQKIWLSYHGGGQPAYYGLDASDPLNVKVPETAISGLVVVSNSRVATATGRLKRLITTSQKVGEVGHSMSIYMR
jgi:hypothetical protein